MSYLPLCSHKTIIGCDSLRPKLCENARKTSAEHQQLRASNTASMGISFLPLRSSPHGEKLCINSSTYKFWMESPGFKPQLCYSGYKLGQVL